MNKNGIGRVLKQEDQNKGSFEDNVTGLALFDETVCALAILFG
jgi:hypothetical protein